MMEMVLVEEDGRADGSEWESRSEGRVSAVDWVESESHTLVPGSKASMAGFL